MTERYDVGVVGYGACAAILVDLLLQKGVSVVVFDKWPEVLKIPRATHIDDEIMRNFQAVGIVDDLPDSIEQSHNYYVYNALDQVVGGFTEKLPEITSQGYLSDYFMFQPDIETYLRTKAAQRGAAIKLHCEVTNVEEVADGVLITFRDANAEPNQLGQVHVSYAVGADGSNSFVRDLLGFDMEQLAEPQRWMICDIQLHEGVGADLPKDSWTKVTPEETITFVPMAKNMKRFEFSMPEGQGEDEARSPEVLERFIGKWFARGDYEILRAHVYHFHSLVAYEWRKGRVFLAGDAAHRAPPFLGQGVCTAIRDAVNLAWKLERVVHGRSSDALLNSYFADRYPHAHALTRIAGEIGDNLKWMATATPDDLAAMKGQQFDHTQARPHVDGGLHMASAVAGGELSPQPVVASGKLLDYEVGYNFALVGDPDVIAAVSDDARTALEDLGAVILPDESSAVKAAVGSLGGSVMFLRPDRYLLGVTSSASEVNAMVSHLIKALK